MSYTLCVGIGVCAAWCSAYSVRSDVLLGEDVIVAVVSDQCPIARKVVDSVAAYPETQRYVVPIPQGDLRDERFHAKVCDLALDYVHERAVWTRPLPNQWLCERLAIHGQRLAALATGTPVYLHAGKVFEDTQGLDHKLQEFGLRRQWGYLVPEDVLLEEQDSAYSTLTVRGSVIGF